MIFLWFRTLLQGDQHGSTSSSSAWLGTTPISCASESAEDSKVHFSASEASSSSYNEHGGWGFVNHIRGYTLAIAAEVLIEHGYICNPLLSAQMSLTASHPATLLVPSITRTSKHQHHHTGITSIEKIHRQLRQPCWAVGRCYVPPLPFWFQIIPTFPHRWGRNWRRGIVKFGENSGCETGRDLRSAFQLLLNVMLVLESCCGST